MLRLLVDSDVFCKILGEFVDLSRTRFGVGLSVTPGPVDLEALCRHVLEELREYYPDCVLRFDALGDLRGEWDGDRVAPMTSYLVRDAIQHCGRQPVGIVARGDLGAVEIEVHYDGLIPPDVVGRVFEPFALAAEDDTHAGSEGNGLGLYLIQQITIAHGGSVAVRSTSEAGTTFCVRLPRHRPQDPS